MKAAFLAVCLLLAAVPVQAASYLELGTAPVVAFQWEKSSFALNCGTGFAWGTVHSGIPFGGPVDETFITLSPTLTGQLFLNQDAKARSFLELRVSKGVPIFSGGTAEQQEQFNDDWSYGLGGGLRSAVADHLNLGGAAD